jgi:hypothetical protein
MIKFFIRGVVRLLRNQLYRIKLTEENDLQLSNEKPSKHAFLELNHANGMKTEHKICSGNLNWSDLSIRFYCSH